MRAITAPTFFSFLILFPTLFGKHLKVPEAERSTLCRDQCCLARSLMLNLVTRHHCAFLPTEANVHSTSPLKEAGITGIRV